MVQKKKNTDSNYYRIEKAIGYMMANYREQPGLETIAEEINISPFNFQRLFLDWVGLTPKKFMQYLTLDFLKSRIKNTANVIEAAEVAGLSSQSRVYDLFINIEGMSPQQYRQEGANLEICYGYHHTTFGLCFIAVTDRGICDLSFIDEQHTFDVYQRFYGKWGLATLVHDENVTAAYIRHIFKPSSVNHEKLGLLVQGTGFQIKVWEALLHIPFGQVESYQQLSRRIGAETAVRSVATAAGKNPISFLIPCHRIICKTGEMGDHTYGKVHKQAMIAWEMAKISL